MLCFLQDPDRQIACTRTDFKHFVCRSEISLVNNSDKDKATVVSAVVSVRRKCSRLSDQRIFEDVLSEALGVEYGIPHAIRVVRILRGLLHRRFVRSSEAFCSRARHVFVSEVKTEVRKEI